MENIAGYIKNFRALGGKLIGNLHLLKTHDKYATLLEMAQVMPKNFGLSAAFKGPER